MGAFAAVMCMGAKCFILQEPSETLQRDQAETLHGVSPGDRRLVLTEPQTLMIGTLLTIRETVSSQAQSGHGENICKHRHETPMLGLL